MTIDFVIAGIAGLLVGSTLNVVISRLPVMLSLDHSEATAEESSRPFNLWVPRSRCESCLEPILYRDLIPVWSWLLLQGRCRSCSASISWRDPIVEVTSVLLALLLVGHFGMGWFTLWLSFCVAVLVCQAVIDLERGLLFDELNYSLLWAGLLCTVVFSDSLNLPTSKEAILGALSGYLSLWSINAIFKLLRKRDGMGNGDFKLFAALGAWVGWYLLPIVILISFVLGSIYGLVQIIRKKYATDQGIPFGPFLATGGIFVLFYRDELMRLMYG